MLPLIERGYLYIAQPPLYRIKRGKWERYIQTEEEFYKFLIEIAIEEVSLISVEQERQREIKKRDFDAYF